MANVDELKLHWNTIPDFLQPLLYSPRKYTELSEVLIAKDKEEDFETITLLLGFKKIVYGRKIVDTISDGYFPTLARRTDKSNMWLVQWRMFIKPRGE